MNNKWNGSFPLMCYIVSNTNHITKCCKYCNTVEQTKIGEQEKKIC